MEALTRRTVMLGAAALAAVTRPAALLADQPDDLSWPFGHRASARAIGERYLRTGPDAGALRAARLLLRPAANRNQRIRARIAADFAAGDVVILDGWVLAATEARLCALAALS